MSPSHHAPSFYKHSSPSTTTSEHRYKGGESRKKRAACHMRTPPASQSSQSPPPSARRPLGQISLAIMRKWGPCQVLLHLPNSHPHPWLVFCLHWPHLPLLLSKQNLSIGPSGIKHQSSAKFPTFYLNIPSQSQGHYFLLSGGCSISFSCWKLPIWLMQLFEFSKPAPGTGCGWRKTHFYVDCFTWIQTTNFIWPKQGHTSR